MTAINHFTKLSSQSVEQDITPLRCTVIVLLTLFAPAVGFGDWYESFDDGTVPTGWEFLTPPWSPSNTFAVDASSGSLLLSESRAPNQGGTGAIRAVNTNSSFSDVRVSADVHLDPTQGTFMGLTVENLTDAYTFGIDFASDGDAWLAQAGPAVGGIWQWGSKVDFGIDTVLDTNSSYFLEFDIVDNQMTGRVYDERGGAELINISHSIPRPIRGPLYAGVYTDTTLDFEHIPTAGTFDNISALSLPLVPAGDLNGDGVIGAADIDLISSALLDGLDDSRFDVNLDGAVTRLDHAFWVHDSSMANTFYGDANLDGEFNSTDLIEVFQAGEYEDNLPLNSNWATGDWNGDGEFDSSDFIVAFQDSGFERGPRLAVTTVPEPLSTLPWFVGLTLCSCILRGRTH